MRPHQTVLLLIFAFMFLPACTRELSSPPSTTTDDVRDLLQGKEFDGYPKLRSMAEGAFPAFAEILSDPKATSFEVGRIFDVLLDMQAERSRFLEHVVRRLADSDAEVRWCAVRLLGQIGSARDASPAVALLSDSEKVAVY